MGNSIANQLSRRSLQDKKIEQLHIHVIGESYVGKACFEQTYESETIKENNEKRLGETIHSKRLKVQDMEIILFIHNENFRGDFLPFLVENTDGVLLLYNVASLRSFHQLPMYLEIFTNLCPGAVIFIIGAGYDLVDMREVSRETGQQFAYGKNLEFFECCSKTGKNVNEIFELMALRILQKKSLIPPDPKELIEGKHLEKKEEKLHIFSTKKEDSVLYGCASKIETCNNSLKSFPDNVFENSKQALEMLKIKSPSAEDLKPGHKCSSPMLKDFNPVHEDSNPGHKGSTLEHEHSSSGHESCNMLTINDPHVFYKAGANKSSEPNEISHTLEDKKDTPLKKEKPVLSEDEMYLQGKCPS